MANYKKFLSFFLCIAICFALGVSTFAAPVNPSIIVSSIDAMPGDTVRINVEMSDNPGIMAMAFCVTYDSEVLTYKNFEKGYLSNYTVQDHADKGHVSFVNVENRNIATDGKIIGVVFEVKKDAKPGSYTITLANSNREKHGTKLHNSFSTATQDFIVPKVISGAVTVQETCENSGHKYGEWDILKSASCTETGLKKHFCVRCNNVEEIVIPFTHAFESEWTIDKAATPVEDGIMSRHCTKCDSVTDAITFSYEEINDDDTIESDFTSSDISSENAQKPIIENTVGEKVPLQEAEKFNDYQQNIKPNLDNSDTQSEIESNIPSSTPDTTVGAMQNNSSQVTKNEVTIFSTPSGIIMIIICSIISVGIIALGVLLIIRNKNTKQ